MEPLLQPKNLRTAATMDKATEIMRELLHGENPDAMAEAMEAAASDADLAEAVIFRLVVAARGWADENNQETGVELVARALRPPVGLVVPYE